VGKRFDSHLVTYLQIADSKDAKSPTHIGDRTAASSLSCFGGNRQCIGAEWLLFVAKGKVVVATADGPVICFGSRQTPPVDSLSPKGGNFPRP
jgi:hypothetical protein